MFEKIKIISPYILAGIIGIVFAIYLHGSGTPTQQSEITQSAPAQSASKLNTSRLTSPSVLKNKPSKTEDKTLAGTCNEDCHTSLDLLYANAVIDDEHYEKLSGLVTGLAAHLEKNHSARMDMLDLAKTTPDGNKRAFLIDAFSLLPMAQREELGTALMKSDNWLIRTNGIQLSASPQSMTPDKAKTLTANFTNEPHSHVKSTILGVIKNSESLKGHQETLDNLSTIILRETNPQVKSDAFMAKFALQRDPLDAMPDTLIALASGETELQQSALIALGRIYESDHFVDGLDRIDHGAIKRGIEDLKDITFDADDHELIRLLNEADRFHERHFPEN